MRLSFIALPLFVIFLSGCETAPKTDVAVRFFNDIAFRGTPGGYPVEGEAMLDTDYSEHQMYRWESEIRVAISGSVTPEYRRLIKTTMSRMSEITGRQARFLSSKNETPNFTVEFVEVDNFHIRKTENVPCYAHSSGNQKIEGVIIKISVEDPRLAAHCIAHELFHGFGFVHSSLLRSVISTKSVEDEMTIWDEMALQTLYDPRLKSGMTRQEAMPIARRIIFEQLGTRIAN